MSDTPEEHKISDQAILKIFDRADDPFLTASEIAEQLPVTRQAVNYRLDKMHSKGLVSKKKTGARAVGWWANVAPELSPASIERIETAQEEIAAGNTVELDDLE